MRMIFGLVGLLVVMAIVLFIFAGPLGSGGESYLGTVAKTNKEKTAQVQQFSGKDPQGNRANTFITLTEVDDGFQVTGSGGPLASEYGLMPGDIIVQIGPQEVPGFIISSEEDVRNFLDEAFARQQDIVVKRGEEQLTLQQANGGGGANPMGVQLPGLGN